MSAAEWIAKRRELLDAATEGPWEAEYSGATGDCVIPHDAQSTLEAVAITRLYHRAGDAQLIADARTSLPLALDALEAVLVLAREWDGSPDLLPASLRPYTRSERLRAAIESALRADS